MTLKKPLHTALVGRYRCDEDGFLSNDLKFAFLWFDNIIFDDLANPQSKDTLLNDILQNETLKKSSKFIFSDIIKPAHLEYSDNVLNKLGKKTLSNYMEEFSDNCQTYLEDIYCNDRQIVPNELDNMELFSDPISWAFSVLAYEHEKKYGLARHSPQWDGYIEKLDNAIVDKLEAVRLWGVLGEKCFFLANACSENTIDCIIDFNSNYKKSTEQSGTKCDAFSFLTTLTPPLSEVSWEKIIQLKNSGQFDPLKRKINDVLQQSNFIADASHASFSNDFNRSTEELLEIVEPNMFKTRVKTTHKLIVSTIPVVSTIMAGVDGGLEIYNEEKKEKEYRWYYSLRKLKAMPYTASHDMNKS